MARVRFIGVWIACFALLAGACAGLLFAVHAALAPEDQREFSRLLDSVDNMLFVFAMILLAASGLLADRLARAWLAPLRRLAASIRLVAGGNPAHRAEALGAGEVREVAAAVNALAARHEALLGDVEGRIRRAHAELDHEKSRLAALMSELASAVVVCTVEGRILLYNQHARQMFSGTGVPGFIGLGRSLFSLIDRQLVAHALDQLRDRLAQEELRPVAVFLASPGPALLLRVRMAPVMETAPAAGRPVEPSGFVLSMDDVSGEVNLSEQRDLLL